MSLPYITRTRRTMTNTTSVARVIDAQIVSDGPGRLNGGRGPFHWGLESTFPYNLRLAFSGVEPIRRAVERCGRPTEMEIYRRDIPEGSTQIEIAYDPSIGYAPRFVRQSLIPAIGNKNLELLSREIYVLDARPTFGGGFVPTEWYCVNYRINRFGERFGVYNEDISLDASGRIGGGHFKVTRLSDRRGSVTLTDLKAVQSIATIGGLIPLRARTSSLALSEIKATAGKRLTESSRRILPHLDATELHEHDVSSSGTRPILWLRRGNCSHGGRLLCRVAQVGALSLIVLAALFAASGCGDAPASRFPN